MKNKKSIISFVLLGFCAFVFFCCFPAATQAQGFPSLVPDDCLREASLDECNISAAEATIGRLAQMILGVTGSLALLMFVIGGVYYVFSSGESDKVKKANKIMSSAVIGIVIILMSGFAIKFLLKAITTNDQLLSDSEQMAQKCLQKGPGWRCVDLSKKEDSEKAKLTCETGLCPGDYNNVCCKDVD